jgi:hypothetical protein
MVGEGARGHRPLPPPPHPLRGLRRAMLPEALGLLGTSPPLNTLKGVGEGVWGGGTTGEDTCATGALLPRPSPQKAPPIKKAARGPPQRSCPAGHRCKATTTSDLRPGTMAAGKKCAPDSMKSPFMLTMGEIFPQVKQKSRQGLREKAEARGCRRGYPPKFFWHS